VILFFICRYTHAELSSLPLSTITTRFIEKLQQQEKDKSEEGSEKVLFASERNYLPLKFQRFRFSQKKKTTEKQPRFDNKKKRLLACTSFLFYLDLDWYRCYGNRSNGPI